MNVLLALNNNKRKSKKKIFNDKLYRDLMPYGINVDFNYLHSSAYKVDTEISSYLRMLHEIDRMFNK